MNAPTPRRWPQISFYSIAALTGLAASALLLPLSAQTAAPTETSGSATTPPAAAAPTPATGGRGGFGRGGARGPRSGLHLADFQLHDPFILPDQASKTYYLYTAGGGGVVYYKSKDLLTWEGPYNCFREPADGWANPANGIWAPEVHFYKGKYYLFATLHNNDVEVPPGGSVGGYTRHMRSTTISISDSPEGPFTLLKKDDTTTPHDFMTIDGTFYVDPDGKPWMVYAHEWVQKLDGTIEALPLKDDLSDAAGRPIYLFKASDAPWIDEEATPNAEESHRVTDGPELYRTKDGHLLMLWSSYKNSGYVETLARSKTGTLKGPWEQLPTLVENDSGHGMLFKTFDGQLELCIGQPFNNQRAKIYDMEDLGDTVRVVKFREDLSGPPLPPGARQLSQRGGARGGRGGRGGTGGRRGGAAPQATAAPAASTAAPAATQ